MARGIDKKLAGFVLLVIALAAAGLIAWLYLGESKDTVLHKDIFRLILQRVILLGFAAFLALASASLGAAILRLVRVRPAWSLSFFLEATAAGLGAFALLFLFLGLLGIMHRTVWLMALVLGSFSGAPTWSAARSAARESRARLLTPTGSALVALAAFPLLLLFLVGFHPPLDYDVQEYHLGAPATWLRQGEITFLPNNVYSSFPSNTEMLFELALVLFDFDGDARDLYWGSYAAISVVILFGVLATLACFDIAHGLGGPLAAFLAAAFFYTCPWIFVLSIKAYVELPLIFFSLLAADRVLRVVLDPAGGDPQRNVILGAIFTGLAMGTKYTAWAYFALPLGVFLLVAALLRKPPFRYVLYFALIALVVVSPWLVRNIVNTGNPVFPMGAGMLPSGHWSAEQVARWEKAHAPEDRSRETLEKAAFGVLFENEKLSLATFLFAPVALLLARRRRMIIGFLLLSLFIFVVWLLFTHRGFRFFVPAIPFLCIASAVGCASIAQRELRLLAVAFSFVLVACSLTVIHVSLSSFHSEVFPDRFPELDLSMPRAYENDRTLPEGPVFDFAWKHAGPSNRMLFLGEAKFFYMASGVEARTVFDGNRIDELYVSAQDSDEEVVGALKRLRFGYIFANWAEIARFNRDYKFSFAGEDRPGYSAIVTPELFARWEGKLLVRRIELAGVDPQGPYVLYEIL